MALTLVPQEQVLKTDVTHFQGILAKKMQNCRFWVVYVGESCPFEIQLDCSLTVISKAQAILIDCL